MRLYLLRHAIAAPRDPKGFPGDVARPLTPEGRSRMERAARGIRMLDLGLDLILTSPLARAHQTARIVARELKPSPPVKVHKLLSPGGAAPHVVAGIPAGSRISSVLLVGHEPDLSRLAGHLLLAPPLSLPIEFRKGGLCRIDFDGEPRAASGKLVFHLTPRLLRTLAGRD